MGRPIKQGLDYFPLDTEWDIKMQLVKARFGLVGIGCIVELYKMIYHEGYALKWDDDTRLLFSADNKIDETELSNIVTFGTEKGVFSTDKLASYGVLTSRGIQKRWLRVARESNRTIKEIAPEILLIDSGSNPIPIKPLSIPIIPLKNALSVPESTHIIGDNRIVKDRIEDNMSRFKKPTLEEVTAYCLERKNSVNPNKWLDFYESKGWKIGNAPMKNWKAAVRTWENNEIGKRELKVNTRGSFLDMEE
jgi:hypothetical protein